jgi:chloramphenicol 3-O phosphotransferase
MMPDKINNWGGGSAPHGFSWKESTDQAGNLIQDLQVGSYAKKINDAYHEIVLLLAKLGHHLIVDDVAFGQEQVKHQALYCDWEE